MCRWVGKRWCLYSQHDIVFSEQAGGASGDSILLIGYTRIVRHGTAIYINLSILPDEGGIELTADTIPTNITLRGKTLDGKKIVLKRIRSIYNTGRSFHILAHRGGGRNAERLGYSENSIEMMIHSPIFGATGIEIDIKRTRDGQLIVFHDDAFLLEPLKVFIY